MGEPPPERPPKPTRTSERTPSNPSNEERRPRRERVPRKERSVEHGKVIGNVNILDLRKATEDSVREVERIANVNLALVTGETGHLLNKLAIGNLNASAEVTPETKVETIMGALDIGGEFFRNTSHPIGLLVMGPVTIAPDVTPEDLERGLAAALVMGPVVVPEPLAGVLQTKVKLVMGPVTPYPVLEKVHKGKLVLDAAYLDTLDPATELAVIGPLSVPADVPQGLIRKKIGRLHVTGRTTCFATSEPEVRAALTGTSGTVSVIPDGFTVVEKEITLTNELLASLSDRKLYFVRSVTIAADVETSRFAETIDRLVCEGTVVCPQALQTALAKVCDLLKTKTFFYEGTLWQIDSQSELLPARFDYLDGRVTLVVHGVLTIAPDVSPDLLASRVAKVALYGVIECSREQQAALESRLASSEGVFDRVREPSEEQPKRKVGNANYLAL